MYRYLICNPVTSFTISDDITKEDLIKVVGATMVRTMEQRADVDGVVTVMAKGIAFTIALI